MGPRARPVWLVICPVCGAHRNEKHRDAVRQAKLIVRIALQVVGFSPAEIRAVLRPRR